MKELQSVRNLMKILLSRDLDDVVFVSDEKGNRLESARLCVRGKGWFESVKKSE